MTNFNTEQMLIMRYGFNPLIPLEVVAENYLSESTWDNIRKLANKGALPFPVVIGGKGKSSTYHVNIKALAEWIDKVSEIAATDFHSMQA